MREACCGDVSVDMAMISNNSSSAGATVESESNRAPAGYGGSVCKATLVICCPVFGFFLGDMRHGGMAYGMGEG